MIRLAQFGHTTIIMSIASQSALLATPLTEGAPPCWGHTMQIPQQADWPTLLNPSCWVHTVQGLL